MRDDRRRLVAAALMTMAGLASWPAFAADGDSAGFARHDIGKALRTGLTFRPLPTTAADTPRAVPRAAARTADQAARRPRVRSRSRIAGGLEGEPEDRALAGIVLRTCITLETSHR